MNTPDGPSQSPQPIERSMLRHIVYGLLIVLSTATVTGRVVAVKSKSGRTPMLSANDRSRWANIRALVDHGTYAIDQVSFRAPGQRDPEWYSIDMVKHRGHDGREHYYSSKPTLLTTILAAPYWVIRHTLGLSLGNKPIPVIRLMLILCNVVPLLVYFAIVAWMIERLGTSDFGRLTTMAAATFGTFLSTFAVTLNNHLPAAICVAATIAVLIQIGWYGKQSARWFALAGFLAAFAAANELPALSFCGLVTLVLLWVSPGKTIQAFLPAVFLVTAAAIGTNYLAHGTWSTPYAHRRDGKLVATIPNSNWPKLAPGKISESARGELEKAGVPLGSAATLAERPDNRGWMLWDPETERRWAIRIQPDSYHVHEWDHWYEYEGTYWLTGKKQGVDRGEPSTLVYAFHALVGHHGIFSLTPIWLASLAGTVIWLRRGTTSQQAIALGTIVLTTVCLTFYLLLLKVEDRNYGGVSCCLRWTLWLVPLWLLCLLPALDALAEFRWMRRVVSLSLFVSVLSATYNSMNPWSHPWLFDYWTDLGWIQY